MFEDDFLYVLYVETINFYFVYYYYFTALENYTLEFCSLSYAKCVQRNNLRLPGLLRPGKPVTADCPLVRTCRTRSHPCTLTYITITYCNVVFINIYIRLL